MKEKEENVKVQVVLRKRFYDRLIEFLTKEALKTKTKPRTVSEVIRGIVERFLNGEKR